MQYGDSCTAATDCAFDCCLSTQTNTQDTDRLFSPGDQCPGIRCQQVRGHTGGSRSRAEDHPISFRRQTPRHGCPEKQHRSEVPSQARASRMPARHVPASQPGQHVVSNWQNEREGRVEKGARPAGIRQIVTGGRTTVMD